MMNSQLSAQRRAVRSLPGDIGQQKTSTYIVPCFLFVEVSVWTHFVKERLVCSTVIACGHQTLSSLEPDLTQTLKVMLKVVCSLLSVLKAVFVVVDMT